MSQQLEAWMLPKIVLCLMDSWSVYAGIVVERKMTARPFEYTTL